MSIADALRRQPKVLVFFEALLIVLVIGALDSLGGWDVSMFLFYAFPILLVVWFSDRRWAIVCAITCGIVWFFAKKTSHPYGTVEAYAWATFNRLAYFLFVAIGGAAMKAQREEMGARMEAMLRARELEQEIVRVSEHEQMRIGQDLHDGLCQNLAAIDCAAACLRFDLENKKLPEAEAVDVIQRMLKEALLEARSLARGIFPVQMDAHGLPAALHELVTMTNRLRQVTVALDVESDVEVDDPETAMHLYRIAQQALNNAIQHAQPSLVTIALCCADGRGDLSIVDDGRGFSGQSASSQGMGLRTMQYRARLIHGELAVDTLLGRGTTISCSFPLSYATHS